MKIVIVGGGKVGFAIAQEVSAEGHDVTIIDSSRTVCEQLSLALDGMTVQGNGASLDVQRAALVPESNLLIAASPNDEANILACMLARKLGCPNTIARIRSRAYLDGVQLLREELGLSMAGMVKTTILQFLIINCCVARFVQRSVRRLGRLKLRNCSYSPAVHRMARKYRT